MHHVGKGFSCVCCRLQRLASRRVAHTTRNHAWQPIMGYTSDEDRWAIIAAWRKHGNISTAARVLGKSRGVVRRWIRRYEETENVKHGKSSGRRPALAGGAAEKALELMLSQDCPGSEGVAQQLQAMGITSKKLHKSTVIRAAKKVAKSKGKPIYPALVASLARGSQQPQKRSVLPLQKPTNRGPGQM